MAINNFSDAALVEEFSAATNERWIIEDCTSFFDEEANGWVVSFKDNGKEKLWRFSQEGDQLNENFFHQLISYTQSRSGYTITTLSNDETIDMVCLPEGLYDNLNNTVMSQAA